ncbi:TrmH family RNA methyltransferase [Neolewinella sp.]|uniref:TrmH family RNA methyltransferase n=1 Tax=Neolewinella sp. TaxID=2993543 RepID=UPI003B52DF27
MRPAPVKQLVHHEVERSNRLYPITLVCPDWRDPRNVGSVFRLADAAGLEKIVLGGTTPRPPHPKIARTARSTVRAVPYASVTDTLAYLRQERQTGRLILGLELTATSESLFTYRLPTDRDLILVAGTEVGGISEAVLAECEATVHLPMHGQNTSMNVATALSAAVYLLLMQLQ